MKLILWLHTGALIVGLFGCSKRAEPAAAPSPTQGHESVAKCGSDAPATPEHCACLGGYVKGDIGDGQVACPQGETELERVQQGIEGAVCCKASAP